MSICVSVIVPTYQRLEMLSRCLAALIDQDFPLTAYEIIIADDAASDATRQLVQAWANQSEWEARSTKTPKIHYVPVTHNHGPAAARNLGWQTACGEIIAFTDDDCIPDRHWLSAGVAAFRDGVIGVSGQLMVPLPPDPTDYERNAAQLQKAEFVTANCFYRREAIAWVQGFDERFTAPWREDSDLFFTLSQHLSTEQIAASFVRAPEAIVVHPVRPAPWGISLRQQEKSRFNALLYKKHPLRYQQQLAPVTPWRYYGIVGALIAAIAGTWLGSPVITVGAIAIWGGLTTWFCQQRLCRTAHTPSHIAEMLVTSVFIPPLSLFWRLSGAIKFRVFFL